MIYYLFTFAIYSIIYTVYTEKYLIDNKILKTSNKQINYMPT